MRYRPETCVAGPMRTAYSLFVRDYALLAPLPLDRVLQACAARDATCASPVAEAEVGAEAVRLELPVAFEGFLRLSLNSPQADRAQDFLPAALWPGHAICSETEAAPLLVYARSDLQAFTSELELPSEMSPLTRGTLLVMAVDCRDEPINGSLATVTGAGDPIEQLTFRLLPPTSPAGAIAFRVLNRVPVPEPGAAPGTVHLDLQAEAGNDTVGWTGLEPGIVLVEAVAEQSGFSYGKVAVDVRPGELTLARVAPSGPCPVRQMVFSDRAGATEFESPH